MAKFKQELPNDILKQVEKLEANTEQMLKDMTQAGAEVTYNLIKGNVPRGFEGSAIMNCLKITKAYKTSDDGIATKIGVYGYFTNKEGRTVPAPLVANMFEYGTSKRKFPKKPFFRKSFKKAQIESAMKAVQDKYLPKG